MYVLASFINQGLKMGKRNWHRSGQKIAFANALKSQHLRFGPHTTFKFTLLKPRWHLVPLPQVTSTNDLSIIINGTLNHGVYFDTTKATARRMIVYIGEHIKGSHHRYCISILCVGLPLLEYCNQAWSPCSAKCWNSGEGIRNSQHVHYWAKTPNIHWVHV